MGRKTRQAIIGAGIAVGIVVFVALFILIKTFTPSKERMALDDYFDTKEDEFAVIMRDHIYEKSGLLIDEHAYIDYDTVIEECNNRFYWDSNENILTYTTPNEVIRAEVGSSDYTINKSKNSLGYPIVKTNGDQVYVALEYVKLFSDIKYEIFEEPKRIVFQYVSGEHLYTKTKKATQLRFEPSIKSPILKDLPKDEKLLLVDVGVETSKKFTKVITSDGIIGYVQNKMITSSEYETLTSDFQKPTYTHIEKDYKVNLVWHQVTNQDANNNLSRLLENTKGITTVSPTWFSVNNSKGGISSLASQSYVDRAHDLGLEVWALVDDFNKDVKLIDVLSYTSRREKLINQLVAEVIKYNIDGINIDFERITADSAIHYIQFLRELSIKCRSNGIVLSIDNYVPAAYNKFYNRAEQGEIADYVIVMGYDEHHGNSETSGSVSSIPFFEEGLVNTLKEVPKERVIMGMPFYTRIWVETTKDDKTTVTSSAWSMEESEKNMTQNGAKKEWDEKTGQYYAEYKKDGKVYKCWLEDERSIESRMKIINDHEVAGVAAWRLGLESSSIWNTIIKYVN